MLVVKQHAYNNHRVNHAVVELLGRIVDVDEIKRAVAIVVSEATNVSSGRINDSKDLEQLVLSLVKLECYAMIPKCASWLLSNDAPQAVVKMLSSTVSARPDDVYEQGSILEATLQTLDRMAKSERRANMTVSCCLLCVFILKRACSLKLMLLFFFPSLSCYPRPGL